LIKIEIFKIRMIINNNYKYRMKNIIQVRIIMRIMIIIQIKIQNIIKITNIENKE